MLEEEMTAGPKGLVVIPKAVRKALKIQPGSKVVIRLENDHLTVEKQEVDTVGIFESIARSGDPVKEIPPRSYDQELSGRNRS